MILSVRARRATAHLLERRLRALKLTGARPQHSPPAIDARRDSSRARDVEPLHPVRASEQRERVENRDARRPYVKCELVRTPIEGGTWRCARATSRGPCSGGLALGLALATTSCAIDMPWSRLGTLGAAAAAAAGDQGIRSTSRENITLYRRLGKKLAPEGLP
ncbi:hypothetical protein TRAPUB_4778 [Trametes pubescens]|uniref:Uncharacterized protein n=1 Tax=Trametes pubescens TaxID=154538 RepID=A0A1M2VA62_TRAPU|nr:hypothetical protein TRAPUB_4778 [Trametes pubescens]